MTYNMTQLQASENVLDLIVYANSATDMTLMNLFMVGMFIILVMILKKFKFDDAMLVSSFICFIISVLLRSAGLIHWMLPLSFLVILAFTGLYIAVTRR